VISRRRFLAAAIGMIGIGVTACADALRTDSPRPSQRPGTAPTATGRAPTPMPTVPALPLDMKIGQMLMVGFRGARPADIGPTLRDIDERGLGGVVLFDVDVPTGTRPRNVESPGQLAELTAALQEASRRGPAGVPFIISVDQEGGMVARLGERDGFPPTESAAMLGLGEPAATREAGRRIAETLLGAGINVNLAPVVDLNHNPANPIIGALGRSFGADPDVVIGHARAFIAGHHQLGIRCTLKHFPGHGSATADTHLGVVDVTDEWAEVELEPFAAIAAAGEADAVLTAHVFNAELDPDLPATLSSRIVSGILRDRLGYGGVVISDDLQMGAIREAFGYEEAVALAIEAGIDVLTIANQQVFEEGIVGRTVEIIGDHIASGRIDEARIDESWSRIRALKDVLV